MSLDKNRILMECEACGLIFRVPEDTPFDSDLCDLIPEKDLGSRKKACVGRDQD